jgi:hypothetical protein
MEVQMTRKAPIALALTALAAAGIAVSTGAPTATAVEVPRHAINICQSATMYENYNFSIPGPDGYKRTLGYGDKIGHTPGAHPVYNGWASIQDFGPNDWGFIREECIGGYDSW